MFSVPSLAPWQWLALPLGLPVAWAVSLLVSRAMRSILPIGTRDDALVAGMAGPITFAWFLAIGHAALPWLGLQPRAVGAAQQILHGLVLVGLFWTLLRVVDAVSGDFRSSVSRNRVELAARVAKLALLGAASVAFLHKLGYPMASLLAGLGIGGLAVALVLRSPLERLFGGMSLVAARRANATSRERDVGIDALRGLAVFTMVGANMVPYMLDQPYPFWFRLYTSLAAPAFILLAGFMVGHLHVLRPVPFSRQAKRALALMLVASLIDILLWGDDPFSTFDVLYLIALVLPASHLALRLPRVATLIVVAVVFLATPVLQAVLGYETGLEQSSWARLKALFVDGWFPVFPWLGVGLLGAALGAFRQERGPEAFARRVPLLGALLLATGVIIWWLTAPEHRTSGGFAELFYPPSLGVLFATLGPELGLLVLLSGRIRSWLWRGLAVYGRVALAMYVVHLAIIAFVIKPCFDGESVPTFVLVYLAHALVLWGLALAIRRLRPAPRSFWGRLLLGS